MSFAGGLQLQLAVKNVEKTLGRRGAERSSGGELGGHLREARAQLRRHMDDELDAFSAIQRSANESVGSLKQVVPF